MNTYVYAHIRLDTLQIFYIGIGVKNRVYTHRGRNIYWHRIVNKAGYFVDKLFENLSWEEACNIEKILIKSIGRVSLKTGPLCNMTGGGEGMLGYKQTKETIAKRLNSIEHTRKTIGIKPRPKGPEHKSYGVPLTDVHRKNISEGHKGLKITEEHRKNLSISKRGTNSKFTPEDIINICELLMLEKKLPEIKLIYPDVTRAMLKEIRRKKTWKYLTSAYNFPMYKIGNRTNHRKFILKILCIEDNIEFNGLKEVADYYKVSTTSISDIINGKIDKLIRINKSFKKV